MGAAAWAAVAKRAIAARASARTRDGRMGSLTRLPREACALRRFELVALGDRQVGDEREDAAEEDVARPRRAQPEPAVLVAVLRHEVADRRAQRTREDVGEPEREHGVEPERVVAGGDRGDHAAEDEERRAVAEAELLGAEVARRGPQRGRGE